MRTLGIDLATTKGSTGICEIDWDGRTSTASVGRFTNEDLVGRIRRVKADGGWTSIDAPFGFPAAFVRSVHEWYTVGTVPPATDHNIRRRLTDCYVAKRQAAIKSERMAGGWNTWPLSSVVDLITPSVIRCAQILTAVQEEAPVDRIGFTSRIVEAYPIAALRVWGVTTLNYKKSTTDCDQVFACLCREAAVPRPKQVGPIAPGCHDDAVDAFVCALIARVVALTGGATGPAAAGGATGPAAAGGGYAAQLATVREEGWIHLPPPDQGLNALAPA